MNILNIGHIIRSERVKRGISQEDLAFDICTTATLSRLENNLHTPNRSIYNALLKKIQHIGYLSYCDTNYSDNTIFDDIFHNIDNNFYDVLLNLSKNIDKYYTDPLLIEQFTTVIKYLSNSQNYDTDIHNNLIKCIRYTINSYDENVPCDFILTNNEIILLYALSIYYKNNKNIIRSIDIQKNLNYCINTYGSELNYSSQAFLQKQLISLYIDNSQYKEALSNIEKYIAFCKTYAIYSKIPDIAFYKTLCLINLKQTNPYHPVIDAYYYYLANEKNTKANNLKKLCFKKFKFTFDIEFK